MLQVPFDCTVEEPSNVDGDWYNLMVVPADSEQKPVTVVVPVSKLPWLSVFITGADVKQFTLMEAALLIH